MRACVFANFALLFALNPLAQRTPIPEYTLEITKMENRNDSSKDVGRGSEQRKKEEKKVVSRIEIMK